MVFSGESSVTVSTGKGSSVGVNSLVALALVRSGESLVAEFALMGAILHGDLK